jgi:hypothetical protein
MGIDFNKIKSKLQSIRNKNQKANIIWRPEKGKQSIRLVPYKKSPDFPFVELYFHYDLAGRTWLSPFTFGRPDPVLEYANKLKKSGDEALFQRGRELTPKKRTYSPILVRGEEKEGVKWWGYGKQVHEELLALMDEAEFGDITDPVKGYDLTVEHKSAEELGASYPKTFIRPKAKPSQIIEDPVDPRLLKMITEEQPDILDVFPEPTYEQLNEALYKHLNPNSDDDNGPDPNIEPPESAIMDNQETVVEKAQEVTTVVTSEPITPPEAPTVQAPQKDKDFNQVFAAFDNLVKKTG